MEEPEKKAKLIVRIIKAIKCRCKCCSGSSCQVGDYSEDN